MIEIDKPEFLVGSEKRFAEFISGLNDKDKIAILTHTDLDGLASGKIVNSVIDANLIRFLDYTDLNESLIIELKEKKINKVIITDLSITDPNFPPLLEKDFETLIIDHHTFSKDLNSDRLVFLNAKNFCAAYLSFYLFNKLQNMEKLDWLASLASISDWAYFNNQNFMGKVYKKYNDTFEIIDGKIRKTGKFWDFQWNLMLSIVYHKENLRKVFDSLEEPFVFSKDVEKGFSEVQLEIDSCVKDFENEKEEINGRYYWEFHPKFEIGSIVSTLTSIKDENKTCILLRQDDKYCHVSARRQDKKENTAQLLQTLVSGFEGAEAGGHIPASGGHFLKKDLEIFKERLAKF